jgi:hypothetical protein
MSYDNTNRGQIWGNDKKTSDSHPDFKGSINVEGKEYWLSAWKRAPDANPKAPSLRFSVQPKEYHAPAQQAAQNFQKPQEDFSDDVPF